MSSEWKSVVLKDALSRIQSGYWGEEHPTEERSNMVRVIRNADVTRDGRRKSFAVRALSDRECEKAALSVGDIALATSGEVGKAWLVDEDGYHATNFLKRLTVNPSVADPGFIRSLLDWESLKRDMAAHTGGSAIQNLRRSFFESVWVMLPPLAEQRRIADLIGSIDSYIDSLQTQVEATRAARSALLSECLSNAGDHWQKTTLGEVAEVAVGPAFKSSVYRTCVDGVPLLRGINIGPDGLRWDEALYWPYHDTPPFEKYLLAANQTVVAMDATFTVQGDIRAGLVNESDLPLLLNQRVAAIAAGPSALSEYVFLLIGSDQFRRFLSRRQTGAFAPHIARRDLVDFPFALPPMNEQRRVADLIGSIDTQVASLDLQVEAVGAVRAAALSELLTGERLLDESYDAAVSH